MGGGVSKSEYERIRKELVVKDQVIRTLQERLEGGAYIGPMRGGDGGEDNVPPTTPSVPKVKESRVSNAELTLQPKGASSNARFTLLHEAKELLGDSIDLADGDVNGQYGATTKHGRLDGSFSGGANGSKEKLRRMEVSAEVMPSRKIMATKERVVYPKSERSRELLLKVLQSNVLFKGQSHGELRDCLDAFFPMHVEPSQTVIKQGAQGDNFYAIESGQLEILVSMGGAPPIRYGFLGPGLGFGELALLYNMPRAATIRAVTDGELWALERNTFREILASHKLNRLNRTLEVLGKIAMLSKLTSSELQQVAAAMDWEEFEEQAAIVRQGEVGEKFYIINKGEIVVTQVDANTGEENVIRRLKAGDHFGEMALFKDEMRSATCTAVTRVQCVTLERAHFIAMLGTLQELMDREPAHLEAKDVAIRRTSTEALVDPADYKYYMQIPREELEVLQTLGRGAFGRVRLVRHAASNRAYALKCLIKSHIVENNLKEHVLNEKRGNVKFPTYMGRASVDLVQKLLCQNPVRRLGNMKHGIKDIINHRWFSGFQWDSLRNKSMKPPIVPQVRDDFDTSNFEDFRHEIEDPGHECDWDPDF
ncbi:hypothetical protein PF008_g3243 [Phytophthora fragariae]|uniref:cGMP-dependent protein kinase n=1 Tax=Phytophthora fragariae TaxID=53985 RepID=A0A6G0SFV4_9STRA|nr:hypothetical protein PF008_g3243 [Phytophthora fragariae]